MKYLFKLLLYSATSLLFCSITFAQVTKTLNGVVRYENWIIDQNINKPNIPGPAGLRVNSFSGGLYFQNTYLAIPGQGPCIDLTFYYNSANTAIDLGYGPGWSMTYSMDVKMEGANVALRRADGRKDVFVQSGPGYTAPVGIFDILVQYMPGKFRLTSKTGMNYFFDDPTHNRLTKITDANNNQLSISYTSGLPTTITDASGRSVTLNYTAGHLTDITDANFSPARHISFVNDPAGSPVQVTDPLGNNIAYQYDPVRNMTRLTDQLGNMFNINYLNCTHVTSITSPLNSMTFSYDIAMLKTTVIEPVNSINQSTSLQFDASGNLQEKIGNCCGFHLLYTYDSQNNVSQQTDANGNNYTYTHDAKGNTTQETDPLSGVSSYVYEPVFNRITSATDKKGNVTTYAYDANGNLLTINHPLGITEHYTYDGNGNVLSYTDGRGFITQYAYNAHGDRTLITYPGGATNSFTYDNVGNLLTATDANGNITTYAYDKLDRLTQTTDALSNVTTYSYNARSELLSVTDALAHVTSYTYDALGRRISTTSPAGTSSMTYDEFGNATSSTDNNGNVTHYAYNAKNLLATETDALNHSRNFTYDANGNRLTGTDLNNNLTTYIYDALNRVTQVTDPLSHNTTYTYDQNSNPISVTDANTHTTTYTYDALNRTTQIQRPIGATTHVYDANNNKTSVTDANGHATTYTYDNRNRIITVTDALSHSSTYTYDVQGNRTSSTDRNGHTSTFSYDAMNRVLSKTNPVSETTTFVYDAAGRTTSRTLPNGNITTYSYDAADRMISAADNIGTLTAYTYDANSNPLTETDGIGHSTTFIYDALNRTTTVTDPLAKSSTYNYDNNSNLLSTQDRNGNTTSYLYDALNRNIQATYPAGNLTHFAYDAVGNNASMTDNNTNATLYAYDANDRLITETYADASAKHYAYDAEGNMISRTDNNGNITTYSYDVLDRLVLRNFPGANDDVFSYDFEGRMTAANNSNANINYTYDNADRMQSENMNGKTTAYVYDIPNRKRILVYPGGRNIEENYDPRMRLSLIKDGAATLSNYNYDPADRLVNRSCGNGTSTNYSYNNNNWITGITHSPGIAQFTYNFDNEGKPLFASQAHRPTNSEKYVYDNNDRLTQYKEGTLSGGNIPAPLTQTQFNYDGVENRTIVVKDAVTTSYTSNAVNEYSNINSGLSITPTYDANGNTLGDGVRNYQFDFENRLINVNGGATAMYKYDAFGRRIQKVTAAGTINYFYDGQRVIEERNGANVVQATYVYGAGTDDILNMKRGGINYFYHQNSLGSVVAVTNNTGNVVERYEYEAYGKPTIYNGAYALQPATTIGNTYMFFGKQYNAETGNYHCGAKFYKPDWGRFGQRITGPFDGNADNTKVSNGGQLGNQYLYANNNSTLFQPTDKLFTIQETLTASDKEITTFTNVNTGEKILWLTTPVPIDLADPGGNRATVNVPFPSFTDGVLQGEFSIDIRNPDPPTNFQIRRNITGNAVGSFSVSANLHEDYSTSNDPFRPQLNIQAQVHYESIPVGTKLIFTNINSGNNANPFIFFVPPDNLDFKKTTKPDRRRSPDLSPAFDRVKERDAAWQEFYIAFAQFQINLAIWIARGQPGPPPTPPMPPRAPNKLWPNK